MRGVRWLIAVGALLAVGLWPSDAGATGATTEVPAERLATAVAQARDGDTLLVSGGVFLGSLIVDKSLTLIGHDWPVLDGGGVGTVLTLAAPDTTVQGFVIRDSGASLDEENAGIAVTAPRATVAGNRFEDTLFGVYLRQAHQSIIRENTLTGKALDVARRGDAIRVWYSNDVHIENNDVAHSRDVVLWYSERLTVRGNDVRDGRYGLHFMYCDDARIEGNRLLHNSVGAFLMYSRRLVMSGNTVAYNRGPSGYGIGLKDMDDAIVVDNVFLANRVGAYLDGSPREVDSIGRFTGNLFAYNDMGVELLPAVRHNEFYANSFIENEEQVAIAGGGRPGANVWTVAGQGNYWSDYAGYDADGDGQGDMAYRSERLFENLVQREPALRLFLFSPAVNALDLAARTVPLVRPQPKLVDERPLTAPRMPAAPALPERPDGPWTAVSLLLIGGAGGLIAWPRLARRAYRLAA